MTRQYRFNSGTKLLLDSVTHTKKVKNVRMKKSVKTPSIPITGKPQATRPLTTPSQQLVPKTKNARQATVFALLEENV